VALDFKLTSNLMSLLALNFGLAPLAKCKHPTRTCLCSECTTISPILETDRRKEFETPWKQDHFAQHFSRAN
jgi:hypothetical protein